MGLSRLGGTIRTVRPDCTLADAARLMIADSIGALVITDVPSGSIEGIVTDRDIVRRIAEGADPVTQTLEPFTRQAVTTIHEGASRAEVVEKLRMHGVRRLPVVDGDGILIGIVSLDDVLIELGEELSNVASTIRTEFRNEISHASDDPQG